SPRSVRLLVTHEVALGDPDHGRGPRSGLGGRDGRLPARGAAVALRLGPSDLAEARQARPRLGAAWARVEVVDRLREGELHHPALRRAERRDPLELLDHVADLPDIRRGELHAAPEHVQVPEETEVVVHRLVDDVTTAVVLPQAGAG